MFHEANSDNCRHARVMSSLPLFFMVASILALPYQTKAQDTVDNTTLNCKYMFGYQGWQRAQGDGCNSGWTHWIRSGSIPDGTNMTVDIFPDLTEFTSSELFSTNMHYSNGNVVGLYSTCNETTIMRHFKWMKDYQVDGVWVQRFGPKHVGWNEGTNQTLLNCKKAAETYGRVFTVMYDVSGANNSTLFSNITTDWMYLVDTFKVTQSPRYLNHKGKPLVSVWGFGFADRSITADVATQIVKWFQTGAPAKYQATVMVGTISSGDVNWRTIAEPWASAIRTADIISPWFVGSFNSASDADSWKTSRVVPDMAECKSLGKDYLPVVWPGFSWSNMHAGSTPQNQIPRLGGSFFWEQVYNCISSGATMLYSAMFDEIDEGTAMLKMCPKRSLAPNEGYWLTADADGYNLPSDWYLRLAGYAKKALCNQIPLSKTMPLNPSKPDSLPVVSIRDEISNKNAPTLNYTLDVRRGTLRIISGNGQSSEVSLFEVNGERRTMFSCANSQDGQPIQLFSQGVVPNGVYILKVKIGNSAPAFSTIVLSR
jgi:hypothetical protein